MTMVRRFGLTGLLVWALAAVLSRPTLGQVGSGSIEGQVTDSQQLAVALASIELEDASGKGIASAEADGNGNYVFNAVPAGSYKLRFSQVGLQPIDQGPVTVESGKATTVNVSLKVARVEQQVTVVADPLTALEPTGSRLDLAPIETPASIVEVNDATMESRGYLQIEDAVASMPGATSGGSPAAPSQLSHADSL